MGNILWLVFLQREKNRIQSHPTLRFCVLGQERSYANSSPSVDIDDQILETLAHPRYRIKLLRLDNEIAKFVQSSFRSIEFGDLQELDGLPQFFRVLASKVGQLYKLNVEHRDGLYYLEKTGETRIPQKSLADISVDNVAVETESTTQQVAKKQVRERERLPRKVLV